MALIDPGCRAVFLESKSSDVQAEGERRVMPLVISEETLRIEVFQ